jgi:hypothetical protein
MNIACSPAQVVGKLVIQIRNLVATPGFPLKTPGRSPLFQIAAYLEIPPISPSVTTNVAITNQTFADIRQAAFKTRRVPVRKKGLSESIDISVGTRPSQSTLNTTL